MIWCNILLCVCSIHFVSQREDSGLWTQYTITYPGLMWLIITGSEFDDWIYWNFFCSYNKL
jgi:hypothetical protein